MPLPAMRARWHCLFQRISGAIQRFNAVLIHESFVVPDVQPDLAIPTCVFSSASYTIGHKSTTYRTRNNDRKSGNCKHCNLKAALCRASRSGLATTIHI